jgi:type IV pilus assembly protein PilX
MKQASTKKCRPGQRGASLLIVLILLAVLLLGGLSMARVDADSTLIAGNTAWRDAALQASEVGLSDAYAQIQALTTEEADQPAAGYFATRRAVDPAAGIDWSAMPSTAVGPYTVRRVVERLCEGPLPLADPARQCVVAAVPSGLETSGKACSEGIDTSLAGKQYRVTVSVTGPRNTLVFVQGAVIR